MKKVLIVVDCQYDFYNPNGSLYVGNGADILPSKIESIINCFDCVVFTLDWHPLNHCSFKENGGKWPRHCIQYTVGASLPMSLVDKLSGKKYHVITKGKYAETEEYTPFDDWYNNMLMAAYLINESAYDCDIYVCGLAGDICVYNTLKSLTKLNDNIYFVNININNVYAITDLCPTISTDFNMKEESEKIGVKAITSGEIMKPSIVGF